jgi:CheY-like chemotaxis protein/DNA-binding XRE family transcriptional regulator
MAASQITSRFGASVRNLRHRMGISQEALADHAGLHRTYITGIECGVRNVTLKSIEKLAGALNVSTATLLLHADGQAGPSEPSNDESSNGKCVDILMVEDNHEDVELTLRAFKQARITNSVQVVNDGEAALEFLFCTGRFADHKRDQPQLVLLDLNLPRISGMDVLRRIKTDKGTRKIPVVVLTVSKNSQDIAECQRLGAEAYIVKPVDLQGLSRAILQLNLNWALLESVKTNGRNGRA